MGQSVGSGARPTDDSSHLLLRAYHMPSPGQAIHKHRFVESSQRGSYHTPSHSFQKGSQGAWRSKHPTSLHCSCYCYFYHHPHQGSRSEVLLSAHPCDLVSISWGSELGDAGLSAGPRPSPGRAPSLVGETPCHSPIK